MYKHACLRCTVSESKSTQHPCWPALGLCIVLHAGHSLQLIKVLAESFCTGQPWCAWSLNVQRVLTHCIHIALHWHGLCRFSHAHAPSWHTHLQHQLWIKSLGQVAAHHFMQPLSFCMYPPINVIVTPASQVLLEMITSRP